MIATSFSFPYLIIFIGNAATFWMYAGINIISAIYSWADFIETKGMDKNQIHEKLYPK